MIMKENKMKCHDCKREYYSTNELDHLFCPYCTACLTKQKPIKLNLGCGTRKMYGFINVDIREDVEPDFVCDITEISKHFKDVDLIYSCHVLEHFPRKPFKMSPKTYMDVLQDWYKALKPGGILRISVPHLGAVMKHYVEKGDLAPLLSFIYGGEKHDYDFHYHGWDFYSLQRDLLEVGFSTIRRYDWRTTEHSYVDDYSQAYLPHMNKLDGTLLSLNVEAIK